MNPNTVLGIALTKACNASCSHCITSSSPTSGGSCTAEELENWIGKAAAYDQDATIAFTGGEVFYVRRLLFKAIDIVRKYGLRYTIQTNGYWGEDSDERNSILAAISDCSRLGISADRFHQDFINIHGVVCTFKAAIDNGISSRLRYVYAKGQTPDGVLRELGLNGTLYEPYVSFDALLPVGRAAKTIDPGKFPPEDEHAPCFAASVPTVCAGGDLFACCGESFNLGGNHALRLGNLSTVQHLSEIYQQSEQNKILQAIRTVGPIAMAKQCDIISDNPYDEILKHSSCGSCRFMLNSQERQQEALRVSENLEDKVLALRALYYGELAGANTCRP